MGGYEINIYDTNGIWTTGRIDRGGTQPRMGREVFDRDNGIPYEITVRGIPHSP